MSFFVLDFWTKFCPQNLVLGTKRCMLAAHTTLHSAMSRDDRTVVPLTQEICFSPTEVKTGGTGTSLTLNSHPTAPLLSRKCFHANSCHFDVHVSNKQNTTPIQPLHLYLHYLTCSFPLPPAPQFALLDSSDELFSEFVRCRAGDPCYHVRDILVCTVYACACLTCVS